MTSGPRVSVIVTTYNQAAYIGEALSSVFAQSYRAAEVIVVDDGSTDATPEAVAPFLDRIRYVRQENQGVAASRNAGIRLAQGELLAFLDGDDIWEPDKLAAQVEAAVAHPTAGLLIVNGAMFGDPITPGALLFWERIRHLMGDAGPVVTRRCYNELLEGNLISTTSQVMIPRRVLDDVGLSDTAFEVSSDYDLYIRIAARYDVTFIDRQLMRWRYLPTSVSGPRQFRSFRWAEEDVAVWRKHLTLVPAGRRAQLARRIRARLHATARDAWCYGMDVDRPWAARYLRRLWRQNFPSVSPGVFLLGLACPRGLARLLRGSSKDDGGSG